MNKQPRVLIVGGGSGGHLLPGLAVAEELQNQRPDIAILFCVSGRAVEKTVLTSAFKEEGNSIRLATFSVPSVRQLVTRPWRAIPEFSRALKQSHELILTEQPDVVVGLGGMTSVPLIRAAGKNRVPVVLLEQNIVAGRATSWLSSYATTICTSFPETVISISNDRKMIVTGNPLRKGFDRHSFPRMDSILTSGEKPTLLVLGGSQGAAALNAAMLQMFDQSPEIFTGWKIVHQTGDAGYEFVLDSYSRFTERFEITVTPYLREMRDAYRSAEIVISRAGATTLAELAACGRATILVPHPYAIRDHQRKNGLWYEERGAAMMVEQEGAEFDFPTRLTNGLRELMTNAERRLKMATAMGRCAYPNARVEVVTAIAQILASKGD